MRRILILPAVLAVALSGAAQAEGNRHKEPWPQGQAKSHDRDHDRDHDRGQDHARAQGARGTGWGVGGIPPGARKKILAGRDYVVIEDWGRYGLPAPVAGHLYVADAGRVLEMDAETTRILGTLGLISALLR